MPNQLADSLSPYLLQHKDNPVDWVPWGEEAFETARRRDVPIFLSVGYAACHWCHVMAHESFENDAIGRYLNEHFVCIKVDREERPDIDQIYMNAVQLMTGHGGWPMSVFLEHDARPFYSGTYWPPTPRSGMPGFSQVLDALVEAWNNRRDDISSHAQDITQALQQLAVGTESASDNVPGGDRVGVAVELILKSVDSVWGGFGGAPKFPHATDLLLLLQVAQRTSDSRLIEAAELTLDKMAAGGIRDHVAGGFARYSVDIRWLVPHFEKMLYDNALLAEVYTRAFQVTGNARHADVALEILSYLQRDMIDESGGIHCSEDADSEGVEGKFAVWTPNEVIKVLGGERGPRFCQIYDITPRGNFEGYSIPNLPRPIEAWAAELSIGEDALRNELADDREQLRLRRMTRIQPGRDDKIVVAWNALAIRAFGLASVVLDRPDFLDTATRASNFIFEKMIGSDGELLHVYRDGVSHLDGYVDDHAILADALITLYEATANENWLRHAVRLGDALIERFMDAGQGGFFYTANDSPALITRNKDWHDGSLVSGNASAAGALLRLARLTGRSSFMDAAAATLRCGESIIRQQSRAAAALIGVVDEYHHHPGELVIAVSDPDRIPAIIHQVLTTYQPGRTVAWVVPNVDTGSSPLASELIAGKTSLGESHTLYVCQNYTCESPIVDPR